MNDTHDLLGAYCTDALDPAERAAFERHLGVCAACRDEADEFREVLGALGETAATVPHAVLEDLVVQAARAQEPGLRPYESASATSRSSAPSAAQAPAATGTEGAGTRRRWARPAAWLAAVAAGAAFFVLGVQVGETRAPEEATSAAAVRMADVVAVASAPDAEVMALDMMGTTARVVVSHDLDACVLLASSLPMPAKGMDYQVWRVMADGEEESAGTFTPDPDGHIAVVLDGGYRGVEKFAITLEPPGGSESPTGQMLGEVDA